jgi:nitrilase
MTRFETVRIAALQATPVVLDAEACVDKAARLINEAADAGVQLAVLPETFVPLYPSNAWARDASSFGGWDELWERLWENSVDVPGPLVDRLAAVCRARDIYCAIGVNERESSRPGTLYNTLVLVGPGGLMAKHRKLMPTHHERLFHGIGGGDDLSVVDTPVGRLGGLICWENRMPLAR